MVSLGTVVSEVRLRCARVLYGQQRDIDWYGVKLSPGMFDPKTEA